MDQREFDENIMTYKMRGNIITKRVPNQLRPIMEEMIANGERPFALVPMTMLINSNIRAQQNSQVLYMPAERAFNKLSAQRWKQM